MSVEVIRYRLPVYWACALINDDYTGLVDWETQGFYHCNDAGTLPGECADFIFHKI